VAIAAGRISRWESGIIALVSVLSYNFCFVEPRFTFAVSDARYSVLFGVMLCVALVISTLTQKLKAQLASSSERERRNSSLYRLSQLLAQQRGKRDLASVAATEIRNVFDGDVVVFLSEHGRLLTLVPSEGGFESTSSEMAVAAWVGGHRQAAGWGTDTLPGASALYLPLLGAEAQVGVLGFQPGEKSLDLSARRLLETFANSLGMALERALLAKESNDARVLAESERIRSTLLSSISHDLRTPLTSITGAATSLREGNPNQKALIETIYDEANRLNHQIQNLLDMTRLQSGGVELDLEWHLPQDLVATALDRVRSSLGSRKLVVQNSPGLPLLKVDGLLIEKALVNLLENAGRYTPPDSEICVATEVQADQLLFTIRDNGPGIAEENLTKLFAPGYRTPSGGYGLGLAVVKAVTDLHGGSVRVSNRTTGGAEFTLSFPLPQNQPEAPHE